MRFLSPLAFIGLASIALVVAIHLLVRRRAVRLDFPSLRFLRETPSFRLRLRRLQQPLLLALRAAAILFLVIGFARPLISFGTKTSPIRVILLDASLSMQSGGRTAAAREQARSVIRNLAAGERAAVIAFSTDVLLLSPATSDRSQLNDAIDRYQPTNGTTDYSVAVSAAETVLQNESPGETTIDIISDFQRSGRLIQLPGQLSDGSVAQARIITHPVGAKLERNAYLKDVDVHAGEVGAEISVSEIISAADDQSGVRKNLRIDTTEGSTADIDWRREANGQITARVRTLAPDDFDLDDEKFLAFDAPRKGRVLLIERDGDEANPYLRAALEAVASERGEKRLPLDTKSELAKSASELNAYSLVTLVLHGRPRSDEIKILIDYARTGGTVWLCMSPDADTETWNQYANSEDGRAFPITGLEQKNDQQQALSFGETDSGSPALRRVSEEVLTALRSVRMQAGYGVTPRLDVSTLIRWNDGTPAFVGAEVGAGRILLLATSPARESGALGASSAFPILASSIARLSIEPSNPPAYEIGEPIELGLEPTASVKIIDASGKTVTAQASDVTRRPEAFFSAIGIYRVESDDMVRFMAFNAPESESENLLATSSEVEQLFKPQKNVPVTRATAWHDAAERQGYTWRLFLLVAFMLLVTELFVFIRRNRPTRGGVEG